MIATKSKDGVCKSGTLTTFADPITNEIFAVVVTTSIGSNTEKQKTENFGTQTSMPRSNVSFKKFLEPKHSIQYMDEEYEEEINGEQELDEIHERLERIRRPSRAAPEAPKPKPAKTKKARIPIVLEDEDSNTVKLLSSQNSSSQDKNSDSEFEDSIGDEPDIIRANVQRKPEEDTFDSWQDMDFPTNKKDRPELPRTYFSDGPTPVSIFHVFPTI